MNNINISFNGKLHFLQNQSGLICASCGRKILSEKGLKDVRRVLEGKKGVSLAQILEKYLPFFNAENNKTFVQLLELSKNPSCSQMGIKNLALHLSNKNVYSSDMNILLHNIFDPILYSADHVVPRSRGGANSYYNFIPMHRSCNTQRSSESYSSVLKREPQFLNNLKKALFTIQDRIVSDKAGTTHFGINIPDDYIPRVINSFAQEGVNVSFLTVA